MTAARLQRGWSVRWGAAAVLLAVAAEATTVATVLGSGQDAGDVRWPLVAAPLAAAAVPLVVPSRATRVGATVAAAAFCVLAAASVGLFFVPSAVALAVAARVGENE